METHIEIRTLSHFYQRSYPTYEEWKPIAYWNSSSVSKLSVLILPMRNGNRGWGWMPSNNLFCSYPTYEEWKLIPNNKIIQERYSFLSYLWGMETFLLLIFVLQTLSSYPTYEEWKPSFQRAIMALTICSYPTYEEWKLLFSHHYFAYFF